MGTVAWRVCASLPQGRQGGVLSALGQLAQQPQCVDRHQDSRAGIGEDRRPETRHAGNRRCQEHGLEAERDRDVLVNVAHRHPRQLHHRGDVRDAGMEAGGIGRFQRHIGAAANGDADIRRRQSRRVVDAVADLRHHETLGPEPAYDALFVLRQKTGMRLDASEPAGDRLGRRPVVAGEHHHAQTLIAERPQARRGIRTRLVAHGKRSGCPPADDEHGDGLPLTLQGFDPSQVFRRQRRALPGRLGRAEEKLDAVCGGGNTLAADGPGAFDGKERQAIGFGTRQDGTGQRMAGSLFERSGVAEDLRLRSAEADNVGQLRPAFGERSGLVEGDGCDPAEIFEDSAALDQKTAACTCRRLAAIAAGVEMTRAQGQPIRRSASPL